MPRMKRLISSLISSMSGLCNVMAFLTFVLSIFAIFGVHQFSGSQYKHCRLTTTPPLNPFFKEGDDTCGKYDPWLPHPKTDKLCNTDDDCKHDLEHHMVNDPTLQIYKCGEPAKYGLSLQSDNVDNNETIFFNILGFEYFPKAFLTVFVAVTLEDWVIMMYNY